MSKMENTFLWGRATGGSGGGMTPDEKAQLNQATRDITELKSTTKTNSETIKANQEWIDEAGPQIAKVNGDMAKVKTNIGTWNNDNGTMSASIESNSVDLITMLGMNAEGKSDGWNYDNTLPEKLDDMDRQLKVLNDITINPRTNFDTPYDAYILPNGKQVHKMLVSKTGKGGTAIIDLLNMGTKGQLISMEGSVLIHKYESNSFETKLLPDYEPSNYQNRAYVSSENVGATNMVRLHLENYGGKYDEVTATYWIYYTID